MNFLQAAVAREEAQRNPVEQRPQSARAHRTGALTHAMLRDASAQHDQAWIAFAVSGPMLSPCGKACVTVSEF